MKRIQIVLAAATLLVFAAGNAMAVQDTASTVTLTATVPPKATLTLSGNIAPAFDLTAVENGTAVSDSIATTVTAKVRTGGTEHPTLTVLAADDFVNNTYSGYNIPASDVSWTATDKLIGGTLTTVATSPATVNGSWTGSGTYTGNMTWKLANNSNYSSGTYKTVSVAYTLTAP